MLPLETTHDIKLETSRPEKKPEKDKGKAKKEAGQEITATSGAE